MLLILFYFVFVCYDMPYAIFLLLLPSLVYLRLITCTYLYTFIILNIQSIRLE